jgi:hypothetical protein
MCNFCNTVDPCPGRAGFLFKLRLPVDTLDGKRTFSDSRLWQEMLIFMCLAVLNKNKEINDE